jgi:hypothetical protein
MHFKFSSISGVMGSFGYLLDLRNPTTDEVISFLFIDMHKLDSHGSSTCDALQQLTSPAASG